MGQITKPKYALKIFGFTGCVTTPQAWRGRLPNIEQLERYIMAECVSTMPGYVNEQIGKEFGIQLPSRAVIVDNRPGGRVLVEWKAPMFQVLPDPADYPEVAKSVNFLPRTK